MASPKPAKFMRRGGVINQEFPKASNYWDPYTGFRPNLVLLLYSTGLLLSTFASIVVRG